MACDFILQYNLEVSYVRLYSIIKWASKAKKLTMVFVAALSLITMTTNVYSLQASTIPTEPDTNDTTEIVIRKQNGQTVTLIVQTALTPEQQSTGLMFVQSLDDFDGMLFDFQESQNIYMWMHNTYIYLDMLFFDSSNRLMYIHENAIPHDLTLIGPHVPVRYVLEIAGGRARDLGISIGDSFEELEELRTSLPTRPPFSHPVFINPLFLLSFISHQHATRAALCIGDCYVNHQLVSPEHEETGASR